MGWGGNGAQTSSNCRWQWQAKAAWSQLSCGGGGKVVGNRNGQGSPGNANNKHGSAIGTINQLTARQAAMSRGGKVRIMRAAKPTMRGQNTAVGKIGKRYNGVVVQSAGTKTAGSTNRVTNPPWWVAGGIKRRNQCVGVVNCGTASKGAGRRVRSGAAAAG